MEEKKYKRTLITTALPYANGPVHIGHLAGVYVPADIYARYLRLRGRDVLMIGGSDEHGVPITLKARKEGVTPQEIVDRYHKLIKESMEGLGISFDIYSRTSSDIHRETAQEFFLRLHDNDQLIEHSSEQLYDPEAGMFLSDRYVTGECPRCHAQGAYGDQCEKCGSTLSPSELINPRSAISGATPVLKETSHWYLPLDRWQQPLEKWILEGHKEWRNNVYGQCKSWLDMGLQPRAVSRDLPWGVPVPLKDSEGKVLYVWFDAPIGYISNTKELRPDTWEQWWKSPDTRIINFIGKDNIVFHCIVFPAMMMAYGDGMQLPDNVPANEFLNLEGDKISTSRNWAVWAHEYLRDFPGKADVLRYVLTATAPETQDNDFRWADFQTRNNSELVGIFGNFVNRAMVLTHKYFDGVVPEAGTLTEADNAVFEELDKLTDAVSADIEHFHFKDALFHAMEVARLGNKYLQENEPWKTIKTDPERVKTILNVALQICGRLAVAWQPFTPFTAERLRRMLGLDTLNWDMLADKTIIPAGTHLQQPELLFDKIEDSAIEAQVQRLADIKKANMAAAWKPEPPSAEIDFDTFAKADLRVATVKVCAKVKKSDKLLQFTLDDGTGTDRTILSGIAQWYNPDDLVGRQVCFVANLAPRKIRGIVSQGMILSALGADGALHLVEPADGLTSPGAKLS